VCYVLINSRVTLWVDYLKIIRKMNMNCSYHISIHLTNYMFKVLFILSVTHLNSYISLKTNTDCTLHSAL